VMSDLSYGDLEIAEAKKEPVSEDVLSDVSDEEIAVEEGLVEKPKVAVPMITVNGDVITVVESPTGDDSADSSSKLNIGGDTNVEN